MGRRGPKKGAIYAPTIDKALKREELRRIICSHMAEMTAAQVRAAKGLNVAVVRRKDGTWRRIESAEAFDAAAAAGDLIEIQPLQPSTQAYTDLMNRALDKPAEQQQQVEVTGELILKWQS
jgi:hypothetical protein